MKQVAYIIFAWLFTFATAAGCGAILASTLRLRFTLPLLFLIGAPLLSLVVFGVAVAGFISKGLFLALGAMVLIAAWRLRAHQAIAPFAWPERWFWLGFAPFTYLYFFHVLAPEMSPDGMAYHLGLVAKYYREGAMTPVPWSMYASLSQGVEMLFLFAFAFGRHSAAAMVHFTYLLALVFLIAGFLAQRGNARAGAVAALLVYACPVVGLDGASAYVDVAVAAIWFGIFVLIEDFEPSRAIPIGVLAGFSYATKYTAALALVYALWRLRRNVRALAVICAVAAIFVVPWMARNWLWLSNPVAPFFNAYFDNPHVTVHFEREYSSFLRTYDTAGLADWVRKFFLTGEKLGGFVGPVFLLAPLGMLEWTWVWAAAAYPLNVGTRFLIPALPFIALGMGKTLSRWRWAAIAVALAHCVLSWPMVYRRYVSPEAWFMERPPVRAALRIESEDGWLNFKRPEYRAARLVESFVPKGEPVFAFSPIAESYTTRDIIVSSNSAYGLRIRNTFFAAYFNFLWPTWRWQWVFPQQRTDRIRIVQLGSDKGDQWSLSEIEIPGVKIVRSRASHFNFGVDAAYDGNRYTRWHSGWPLKPGMSVEFDFDKPAHIASVIMHLTRDQWGVRLRLDKWTPQGWQPMDGVLTNAQELPEPRESLRRWAGETIRGLGVRYFLVNSADYGYDDFAKNATDWNITLIAERAPYRLYRLN